MTTSSLLDIIYTTLHHTLVINAPFQRLLMYAFSSLPNSLAPLDIYHLPTPGR
jgi:hypothetical protein